MPPWRSWSTKLLCEAEGPSSFPSRSGPSPLHPVSMAERISMRRTEWERKQSPLFRTPENGSFQASGICDETTLPTCPWAGLDIAGCCLSLLPPCHLRPQGASVASAYLTQGSGLGARPDPAGTSHSCLYPTCVVADRTICHPCFLYLSPPHLPRMNTAGVRTLTLGPQGRHQQSLQELWSLRQGSGDRKRVSQVPAFPAKDLSRGNWTRQAPIHPLPWDMATPPLPSLGRQDRQATVGSSAVCGLWCWLWSQGLGSLLAK